MTDVQRVMSDDRFFSLDNLYLIPFTVYGAHQFSITWCSWAWINWKAYLVTLNDRN